MGVSKEAAQRVLKDRFNCTVLVGNKCGRAWETYQHLPEEHRPPQHHFNPCGTKVLCRDCSELASNIGKAWHIPTATEIFVNLVRELVKEKNKASRTQWKQMHESEIHDCHPKCPQRITIKQLRQLTGSGAKYRESSNKSEPNNIILV